MTIATMSRTKSFGAAAGSSLALPQMLGTRRSAHSPGSPTRTRPGHLVRVRPLATRLSQEMTASIVFFIALGWAGDRGALARASSSLAPIS